jgi:hypothetical protein
MIKFKANPTFKFKVEIAQAGSSDPAILKLVGTHKRQSELKEYAERAKDMQGEDVAYLLEAIDGWDDVVDPDGKAIKFSPETFGALLDEYPGSALVIFGGYLKELSANRTKN